MRLVEILTNMNSWYFIRKCVNVRSSQTTKTKFKKEQWTVYQNQRYLKYSGITWEEFFDVVSNSHHKYFFQKLALIKC